MKRRWTACLGIGLITILVGGLLYLAFRNDSIQEQLTGKDEIQQAVARTGDLTLSVSGSGALVPVSEAELGFQDNGELVELNVQVGDQVQVGNVLARLQIDQSPAELAAHVANAELDVIRAQQTLNQLYENAQLATAQALLNVEEAQTALNNLKNLDVELALAQQELRQAEEAVQEAEMNLYIVNSSPSQQAMNTAYASMLFKEKELKEIQDQIAQVEFQFKSAPNKMVRDRLDQQLKNLRVQLAYQQLEYENALSKYYTLDDPPEAIEIKIAEAQLATAQAQLAEAQKNWEEAQVGPKAGDLAMAEALLANSRVEWERLKNGPDPDEISLAKTTLTQAKAKLAMLQAEKLVLDLVAPMDGTVISINADVGDRIGNDTIITLADISQSLVEVSLDEVDRAYVQIGNRAEITFDSMPEQVFQGQVIQVDPSLISVGNSQAVRALVLLDELPNELISLPLGLNATVDIISGEVVNGVLVTIDALQKGTNGSYIVYVIEGEALEPRPVQVGLMDATTAEIAAGLQAGEVVAIGNLDFDQE